MAVAILLDRLLLVSGETGAEDGFTSIFGVTVRPLWEDEWRTDLLRPDDKLP